MGLDIVYFRQIHPVLDDGYHLSANPAFPGRADEIKDGQYGSLAHSHFRAGSYSGYNEWRNQLAFLAGYAGAEDAWANCTCGPFWELINFSDCEGVIGPVTSAKLAKDFADYQEKADEHESPYFRDLYKDWRIAFETASDNGAVLFC